MKVEIKSIDDRNNENLITYFETEFMKKVFLHRFDYKDWNLFCKDFQVKIFSFSVKGGIMIVDLSMVESDYHLKRIITYLEEYLENTLEDYTQWLYSSNSFTMDFEGEVIYL